MIRRASKPTFELCAAAIERAVIQNVEWPFVRAHMPRVEDFLAIECPAVGVPVTLRMFVGAGAARPQPEAARCLENTSNRVLSVRISRICKFAPRSSQCRRGRRIALCGPRRPESCQLLQMPFGMRSRQHVGVLLGRHIEQSP